MDNYCLMHSGERTQVEKALDNFAQLENIYVCFFVKLFDF